MFPLNNYRKPLTSKVFCMNKKHPKTTSNYIKKNKLKLERRWKTTASLAVRIITFFQANILQKIQGIASDCYSNAS
jgi:hypothetical protein